MSFWRAELLKVIAQVKAIPLLGAAIHDADAATAPVDADEFALASSADSFVAKKITWVNLKEAIRAFFYGTNKVTPVDADVVGILDSATSYSPKYSTWAQIKAALVATANTWSANQTFLSTDAGAGVGPSLDFYRNSASPAVADLLAYFSYTGNNSAAAKKTYFDHYVLILDPTAGSEDVRVDFRTIVAGATTTVYQLAAGMTIGGATGGDKGVGSLNASGLYISGVALSPPTAPVTKSADFTLAATESSIINAKASSCVMTLPAASSFPGRELDVNNEVAQTLVSASSNVVPKAGGAAGTAILPATAGAWARLKSNGTNWKIMWSGT